LGTACYIKGSPSVIEKIHEQYGIAPGETTPDKQVSLVVARCLGACGLAPAAVFDSEVVGKLTPEDARTRIQKWLEAQHA
jgi:bidirectional [NiFe] hydrogenase diaphorase subunit